MKLYVIIKRGRKRKLTRNMNFKDFSVFVPGKEMLLSS